MQQPITPPPPNFPIDCQMKMQYCIRGEDAFVEIASVILYATLDNDLGPVAGCTKTPNKLLKIVCCQSFNGLALRRM